MAEPDSGTVRTRFAVQNTVSDGRIEACLNESIRSVKRKIGIEAYNEIFDEEETPTIEDSEFLDENTTTADEEALRLGQVTDAVYYYTVASLVLNTQLRIRPAGIVKKEQDATSPAISGSTNVINEYISVDEAIKYSNQLRSLADRLIGPYVIEQEPVNANSWGRSVRA